MKKPSTVTAVFQSHTAANRAMEMLMERGFDRDDISLLMSKETRATYYPEDVATGEGVAWGAGIGAIVGGLIGIAAAPPFGLFVAGPIAGLFAGAAGGGLLGALVDMGVPEARAALYQERIGAGGILIAVDAETRARADEAESVMLEAGDPLPRETVFVTGEARI